MIVGRGERARKSSNFNRGSRFTQLFARRRGSNRATPKTQSAMLETMQEGTVDGGRTRFELSPAVLRSWPRKNRSQQEGKRTPLPE